MAPVHVPHYGPAGRSPWLDVDWRRHRRWIQVQGRPVNLVELGSGPPVVFVHGLSGGWQNWLENIPVIAEAGYRCIAMDLPGFGESPMPADPISIAGYARFLDALLGELGVDAACVVGNSMGGYVAAELAIAVPQRVERLVLVAAAGITSQELRNERLLAGLRRAEWLLGLYGGFFAARSQFVASHERLRRRALMLITAHPELLPGPLVWENLRGSGKPGFVAALDALTNYPIKDRLQEIACPALVVWGERDYLVPVRDADVFSSLIPDARKVVFADTGHVPQLERPEAVNRLLLEFLAEAPGEEVGPQDARPGPAEAAEEAAAAAAEPPQEPVGPPEPAAGGSAADLLGPPVPGVPGDGVAADAAPSPAARAHSDGAATEAASPPAARPHASGAATETASPPAARPHASGAATETASPNADGGATDAAPPHADGGAEDAAPSHADGGATDAALPHADGDPAAAASPRRA